MDLLVGEGDAPMGLNSTALLGDPEEEEELPLNLQLQLQLRAQWEDNGTQGCGHSMFQSLS